MKQFFSALLIRLILSFATLFLSACSVNYDGVNFDKEQKITTVSAIEGGDQVKIRDLTRAIVKLGSNMATWESKFLDKV